MGDYIEVKKELNQIKISSLITIIIELIIAILIIVLIHGPYSTPLYIVEKWWSVLFWCACAFSNSVYMFKAIYAINNPEILLNIQW